MINQGVFLIAFASFIPFSFPYPSDPSFVIGSSLFERDDQAITEWTGMGDSYASGVGAGDQPPDDTNSGNTFKQILAKEFLDEPEDDGKYSKRPAWGKKPEFATITMGGNDIGILNLISTCVYSFKLWGKDCEQVIQEGQDIIKKQSFKDDMKAVIQKAITKGRGTGVGPEFKLFVTGYAHFKPSWNPATAQKLTVERRKEMNGLALALNKALESMVNSFPSDQGVIYVDYDADFKGHRFCDRKEPNPDDEDTWFFNWKTQEDPATQQLFNKLPAYKSQGSLQADADFLTALADAASNDPKALGTLSDSLRVFHPKFRGHEKIRDVLKAAIKKSGIPEPSTPPPVPTKTPPPPSATCSQKYKVVLFSVTIEKMKDFTGFTSAAAIEGPLRKQMSGCGSIIDWKYHSGTGGDESKGASVTFNINLIPVGCISRALKSAGGPALDSKSSCVTA